MNRREFISRVTVAAGIPALPPIPPNEPPEPIPAPPEPTSLVYNGVRFEYPSTRLHVVPHNSADPIGRAHFGRLDIVLSAEGVVLLPANSAVLRNADVVTDAGVLRRLRYLLTEPRRPLQYRNGLAQGLSLPDGDNGGGPFPETAEVVQYGSVVVLRWTCRVVLKRTGFTPAAWYDPRTLS